jgi:Fe(3+) dicitrate transport protein
VNVPDTLYMPLRTAPVRLLSALLITLSMSANGREALPGAASGAASLDEVTIIGHRRDPADVPGSAHVIDQEDLEVYLQSDVMRVLRSVPGVYLQDEDGFGLRPNIGIRGSGLDRSARVAILEDGVLIAPAPYAAPAAYYFPTQRRMYGIEVLKGPSSIAVGPKTTGGAVNLISTPIPDDFAAYADLRAGQNNAVDAHLYIGDRGQRFSWLVETVQAENDGFKFIDGLAGGNTGFNIRDYRVKLQFDSDPVARFYQSLRLKAGITDQVSNETYLGLVEDDFWQNPNRRYAASAGDVFAGKHEQFRASYVIESEGNWRGEVTAYRNNFARDWFKLQSVGGVGISSVLGDVDTYATEFITLTGGNSLDDAIMKRHNDRTYVSQGVQANITWDFYVGDADFELTAGMRVHEDEEDRLQSEDGFRMEDSTLIITSVGAPGSTTNRLSQADAISYFIDTEIRAGKWIFTPGARFEDIDMQRMDFSTADPARLQGPTRVRTNSLSVLIPGVGALYELNDNWRVFGGLHKGFNPPGPGSNANVESSINLEFGTRYNNGSANFEAIYFLNDYDNLVGTVTASTGGEGMIGDQFDGGKVTVQGIEFSGAFDGKIRDMSLPLSFQYTWTAEAEFNNTFASGFEPWGDVRIGDELPYIPQHQMRASAGLQTDRWGVNLAASYVGQMRAIAGQGAFEPGDTIDSHVVWDFISRWNWSDSWSSYVKVDNLFDEVYIVSRRPAGVRPGLERTAYLGLTFTL